MGFQQLDAPSPGLPGLPTVSLVPFQEPLQAIEGRPVDDHGVPQAAPEGLQPIPGLIVPLFHPAEMGHLQVGGKGVRFRPGAGGHLDLGEPLHLLPVGLQVGQFAIVAGRHDRDGMQHGVNGVPFVLAQQVPEIAFKLLVVAFGRQEPEPEELPAQQVDAEILAPLPRDVLQGGPGLAQAAGINDHRLQIEPGGKENLLFREPLPVPGYQFPGLQGFLGTHAEGNGVFQGSLPKVEERRSFDELPEFPVDGLAMFTKVQAVQQAIEMGEVPFAGGLGQALDGLHGPSGLPFVPGHHPAAEQGAVDAEDMAGRKGFQRPGQPGNLRMFGVVEGQQGGILPAHLHPEVRG